MSRYGEIKKYRETLVFAKVQRVIDFLWYHSNLIHVLGVLHFYQW